MDNIYDYGNMHWCVVFFENSDESKKRPIFVVDNDDGDIYFFRITSQEGLPHQRKYRPPLINWRAYGLDRASYINIEFPLSISEIINFSEATHIAKAKEIDIKNLEFHLRELGY
ncbi:hypothetical protein QI140_11335 [Staphylococcus saprophyticus]|uniref:hypothetical protein n=1 Tax=Staphylococcus saprophyticus TaxID=29385 RepID=UPI0012699BE5|nr:hypothetical protein [Staphylococcus saprophyticus]MDW4486005.1 hypothetical protein [Staphylococcus saprophyticus]